MPRVKRTKPQPIFTCRGEGFVVEIYEDGRLPHYRGWNKERQFHELTFAILGYLCDLREDVSAGRRKAEFAEVRSSAVKLAQRVKPYLPRAVNDQVLVRRCSFALRLYAIGSKDDSVRSNYIFDGSG
jgi:hypothetical protein